MSQDGMANDSNDFKVHVQAGGVLFARGRDSGEWLEYDGKGIV